MFEKFLKDERVSLRNKCEINKKGKVAIYWMQRSQRAFDNSALNFTIKLANELKSKVLVVIFLFKYVRANSRHNKFFIDGLYDIKEGLKERGIGLKIKFALTYDDFIKGILKEEPIFVVSDENPIKEAEKVRVYLSEKLNVPFFTVDSDVVVPSKLIGSEVYNAKIMRMKIMPLLKRFLKEEKEEEVKNRYSFVESEDNEIPDLKKVIQILKIDNSVLKVAIKGGYKEGLKNFLEFLDRKINFYSEKRNDPNEDVTSKASPYLHFGHLSPVRLALLTMQKEGVGEKNREIFLEQLIVRRELAINFVKYNDNYDNVKGFPEWAIKTLNKHIYDPKEIYSLEELEMAKTDDEIWNCAQLQMVKTGFMHNYLRMYWAKKLLLWSKTYEEALERAIYLNDKYLLDGRDPNGYTGIAWSIGGKHDRPFPPDKPIFGLLRIMTINGMKKKFDVKKFITTIKNL